MKSFLDKMGAIASKISSTQHHPVGHTLISTTPTE